MTFRSNVVRLLGRVLRIVAALLVLAVLGCAWVLWNFDRPPFDLAKLERLSPGMSKSDVREVLGRPRHVGEASWVYIRLGSWPLVQVYFDASGRFVRSEFDF